MAGEGSEKKNEQQSRPATLLLRAQGGTTQERKPRRTCWQVSQSMK